MALLCVKDLNITFSTPQGNIPILKNISFSIGYREIFGIVGESGSGKSQLFFAIMGLLSKNGRASGSVHLDGEQILGLPDQQLNKIRGKEMTIIFQDAMTSLNPYKRIGPQLTEVLELHLECDPGEAFERSVRMLDAVRLPQARASMSMYPHEISGGMKQRVLIAMALLCHPKLLIADEPTTALDVTVQAQILCLLRELQKEFGMSIAFITHDLGVIAGIADRVMVMYGGLVMESGTTADIFHRAQHPYTRALLFAAPRSGKNEGRFRTIPGNPPNPTQLPTGCPFRNRCRLAEPRCAEVTFNSDVPSDTHYNACPYGDISDTKLEG